MEAVFLLSWNPAQKSHEITRGCKASPGISKWKEADEVPDSLQIARSAAEALRFRHRRWRDEVHASVAFGSAQVCQQPRSSPDSSPAGPIFSASLASLVMSRTPAHVSQASVDLSSVLLQIKILFRLEDIELPLTAKGVAFVEPLPENQAHRST